MIDLDRFELLPFPLSELNQKQVVFTHRFLNEE